MAGQFKNWPAFSFLVEIRRWADGLSWNRRLSSALDDAALVINGHGSGEMGLHWLSRHRNPRCVFVAGPNQFQAKGVINSMYRYLCQRGVA